MLGIDETHVDGSRVFESVFNRMVSDFVKGDAMCFGFWEIEDLFEMPGNGFSFTIFIGCEIDSFGFSSSGFEFFHDFAGFERDYI